MAGFFSSSIIEHSILEPLYQKYDGNLYKFALDYTCPNLGMLYGTIWNSVAASMGESLINSLGVKFVRSTGLSKEKIDGNFVRDLLHSLTKILSIN